MGNRMLTPSAISVIAITICYVIFALGLSTGSSIHIQGQDEIRKQFGGNLPLKMQYIGGANGKHYFGEKTDHPMNWTEASDYCQSFNMGLASIQTENQSEALVEGMTRFGWVFPLEFWTSAREARYFGSAFRWNDTGDHPTLDSWRYVRARFEDMPYRICATYTVQAIYSVMSSIKCSELVEGTLCQYFKD